MFASKRLCHVPGQISTFPGHRATPRPLKRSRSAPHSPGAQPAGAALADPRIDGKAEAVPRCGLRVPYGVLYRENQGATNNRLLVTTRKERRIRIIKRNNYV
eukprot:scaffold23507_cov63-Phaeocystis_antarctica.AAC.7